MAFIPAAIVKTDNPMASRMRKEVCHLIRPRKQITRMVEMRMVSMYSYFEKNTGTPISVTTSRITPPPIAVTVASVRIPKKSIFFFDSTHRTGCGKYEESDIFKECD